MAGRCPKIRSRGSSARQSAAGRTARSSPTPSASRQRPSSFAVFDMTQEKTLTGVVSKFEWTNPHTFIFVDVPTDKGVETWAIEGMSPNYLGRRGWSKNSVRPGDRIAVSVRPLKEGKPGGM